MFLKSQIYLVALLVSALIFPFFLSLPLVESQSKSPPKKGASSKTQPASKSPSTASSNTQSDPQKRISFLHVPPKPDDIPFPGQPFTISAGLTNTRETRYPMRVAISKDGRFMEVPANEAFLDKRDRPIYEFTIPAPVAEMIYQMFVIQPNGEFLSSPRYAIRRSCIPQIDLATGQVSSEVQGIERLRKLVDESRALDNDLLGYHQALKLLGQLKEEIG